MIKLLRHFRVKEWIQIAISLVFILVQVAMDLRLPEYMSEITRLVQTPGSEMGDIWIAGGYMIACALGSLVSAIVVVFFTAKIASSFGSKLRSLLFNKVDSFSMEEINHFSTSSLITRSTNDVTQVQMIIAVALQLLVKAPLTAVWAIIKIDGKASEWTFVTALSVIILLVLISTILYFVMPKFKMMQVLNDNMNRVTMENLSGLRVVRAYNAEQYQERKFELANEELTNTQMFTSRAIGIMGPTVTMVMNGLSLAIFWLGAFLISQAQVTDKLYLFSDMVVFSNYAMQIILAFMMLVVVFVMLPRATVSAKRINEVLDMPLTILEGSRTQGIEGKIGEVTFERVSFKYPAAAEYVLSDISFTVKKGETIAFIGSTGCGKSTLLNLVPRLFDTTEGAVLVDGVNVKEYTQTALNNKLGYVPQSAVMFKGTVNSNVGYGDNGALDYTANEIIKAINIAQGKEFVEKMDGTYDASIAQRGTNVSGGQKQRLAIARAVCRKPEIYLFDDSFSALDYKTDRILRSELKRETAGITSMIVAQRIGTIMDADQIIVLDEGRMVGQGTHQELLKTCDVYRQIAKSQLSEEELER